MSFKRFNLNLTIILILTFITVNVHAQDKSLDANSSLIKIGKMDLTWPPFKGSSVGKGIRVRNTEIKLASPSKRWKGHWHAGNFRLPGNGKIVLRAEVKGGRTPSFALKMSNGSFLPKPDSVKVKNNLYEATWLLKNSKFQILSSLWMALATEEDATASAKILELSVWRTLKKNNLDADKILKTPPVHRAELKLHKGAMTMFIDDQPITGQSWSSLVLWRVNSDYLKKVLPELDYPITSIPITIGEDNFNKFFPSSWLAPDVYDWSYLETQVHRVLAVRPKSKIVLMLVLNGAVWWNEANPESANFEIDAIYATYGNLEPKGIPDYLSPKWRTDIREALRQLVAHVQSSDWGEAVIAYEFKNGTTMDCNFVVPHSNPRVIKDFRSMLKRKYLTDAALQKAWNDPKVTLASALIWDAKIPTGIILEPAKCQRYFDSKELIANQYREVFSDVAKIVKEATHGRAIVGARTGDFYGNNSHWKNEWFSMEDSGWLPPLLNDPNFDYFDVQEPYPGRQLGSGAGVPVIPPFALQQYGKTVVIQNDVRTHLSRPNAGYGRTPDLASTIQLQRRVFANSLTYNMIPYLYQLAFSYYDTDLLSEYRKQKEIMLEATTKNRSSVAQVAIVLDPRMRLYIGLDPKHNMPTSYAPLLNHAKHVWQRGGAPFDMIFLDQIETLPPYRVYVFCNTWRYTPKQIQMIRKKVLANGQCAVFLWADGVVSDNGSFSAKTIGALTGMNIQMSRESESWRMKADKGIPGLVPGIELGTLSPANYSKSVKRAAEWDWKPSFQIKSGKGTVPLAHRADGSISAAMRQEANYTVIYSASGNLTAPILKLAIRNSKAFNYTDSSALLMMNSSYLGFHTDKDETITLKLPKAQKLVNLFTGEVLAKNTIFKIPVRKNHTYLFERQ